MKIQTQQQIQIQQLSQQLSQILSQQQGTLTKGVCTDVVIDLSQTLPVVFHPTCSKNKQKLRNKKKK